MREMISISFESMNSIWNEKIVEKGIVRKLNHLIKLKNYKIFPNKPSKILSVECVFSFQAFV